MLTIDFIGLLITICIVSLRYPHFVLISAFVHDIGMVFMTLFFNGQVETIVTAGAFSSLSVSSLSGMKSTVIALTGPLVNYTLSALVGGTEFERTSNIFNPFSCLEHPFAVINLRLALLSLLATLWQLYWT